MIKAMTGLNRGLSNVRRAGALLLRAGALLLRAGARPVSRPTKLFIPEFEPTWADSTLNSVRWPGWPLLMSTKRLHAYTSIQTN